MQRIQLFGPKSFRGKAVLSPSPKAKAVHQEEVEQRWHQEKRRRCAASEWLTKKAKKNRKKNGDSSSGGGVKGNDANWRARRSKLKRTQRRRSSKLKRRASFKRCGTTMKHHKGPRRRRRPDVSIAEAVAFHQPTTFTLVGVCMPVQIIFSVD